jgi:hypothetical protein
MEGKEDRGQNGTPNAERPSILATKHPPSVAAATYAVARPAFEGRK